LAESNQNPDGDALSRTEALPEAVSNLFAENYFLLIDGRPSMNIRPAFIFYGCTPPAPHPFN
jgi:hypothetical protein